MTPALIMLSSDDEADHPTIPVVVDFAGRPSGLGRTLWTLVRRDGYRRMLTAVTEGGHWRQITAAPEGDAPGAEVVPGYGLRRPSDRDSWLACAENLTEADGVWWYVLEQHGMLIERRVAGRRHPVRFVAWTDDEPAWSDLDAATPATTSPAKRPPSTM